MREVVRAANEHALPTHASAIAFRALISLVPLTLLGLALLGAVGLEEVWTNSLAPAIRDRTTPEVYRAIDASAETILSSSAAGLIAVSSVLLLWNLTRAVSAVMVALNAIHGVSDTRVWWRRYLLAASLAVALAACLVGSFLAVTLMPRLADGALQLLARGAGWLVALVLLGVAVVLLVRYAPAERPPTRWASAGSVVVVGTWALASLAFAAWADLVGYETAVRTLLVFLFLTTYVLASSAIFLMGVQLDEVLRKRAVSRP